MLEQNQMVKEMFKLQAELNNSTNGIEWLTGVNKHGKDIDWLLCAKMEITEMIGCFPWKHWKSISEPFNVENFKVELVDVWHFLMSELITLVAYDESKKKETENPDIKLSLEEKLELALATLGGNLTFEGFKERMQPEIDKLDNTEKTLLLVVKSFLDSVNDLNDFITHYFMILALLERDYGFGFNDMYNLYIGKNALNKFRQDNGYKEGSYVKIWDGEEDNVYMQSLLTDKVLTFNELYDLLDVKYKEITK